MYPTSDNYKKIMQCPTGRDFHAKAHVEFADGTAIDLDDRNILADSGIAVEDAVSDSDKFQLGGAIIGQLALKLNNFEGDFNKYNFKGAVITPSVGLTTAVSWKDGKIIEWISKGVFTVNESPTIGSEVDVTGYDNMAKLDVAYSKSTLAYPATLGQIAADACSVCGVPLATTAFPNSAFVVNSRPSDSSTTCREILFYVAQLAGCFARCNTAGAVEIRWYADGDTIPDVGDGAASCQVADSDTTITGVEIDAVNDTGSDSDTSYSVGESGFTIHITDNPLAQGSGLQDVVNALGTKFIGFSFRTYSVSSPANPAIEAGDAVNMTDKSGTTHKTFVSRLSYEIGENEEYNADAESAEENQSQRFSAAQKAQDTADQAQQGANEAKASIEVLNGQITLKADKGALIAEINVSPESIKISASKLELSGLVTVSNLENGTTTIDGACIKTGRIESEDGTWWLDLDSGKVYMKDGTFAGTIQWADGSYIKHDSSSTQIYAKGALQISSGNGGDGDLYLNGSESAGGGTGIAHCHYLSAYSLEAGAGGIYSSSGITTGGTLAGSNLQIGGHTFSVTRMTTGDGKTYYALLEAT